MTSAELRSFLSPVTLSLMLEGYQIEIEDHNRQKFDTCLIQIRGGTARVNWSRSHRERLGNANVPEIGIYERCQGNFREAGLAAFRKSRHDLGTGFVTRAVTVARRYWFLQSE